MKWLLVILLLYTQNIEEISILEPNNCLIVQDKQSKDVWIYGRFAFFLDNSIIIDSTTPGWRFIKLHKNTIQYYNYIYIDCEELKNL